MPTIEPIKQSFLSPKHDDNPTRGARSRLDLIPTDEPHNEFLKKLSERRYEQQYANLYYMRIEELKPRIISAANRRWGNESIHGKRVKRTLKVLDIQPEAPTWVIGTIFCEMKYKPDILEEISRPHWGAPPPKRMSYSDPETDITILEDESGRVTLAGDLIKSTLLVTGCVVAVLGMETVPGSFHIVDIVYPDFTPQLPLPKPRNASNGNGYIAIVSGLDISSIEYEGYSLEMLKEFLTGEIGGDDEQLLSSNIQKLIIAGNLCSSLDDELGMRKAKSDRVRTSKTRDQEEHPAIPRVPPTRLIDSFISEIAYTLPIDIMPGPHDVTPIGFPQQPLHRALFPRSRNGAISLKTNPYIFDLQNISIIGSSGQPIDDIYKYNISEIEDSESETGLKQVTTSPYSRLETLESSLRWQHIAPTAPDTLACYPFVDNDPFIIKNTPHVYFVANQSKFETKISTGIDINDNEINVRLICVPRFSTTGQLVLLNVNDLSCKVISFKESF